MIRLTRREHLQYAGGRADALGLEVRDADSTCQALVLAVRKALHEAVVHEAVGDESRPMDLVEPHLVDAEPCQACPVQRAPPQRLSLAACRAVVQG